MQKAERKQVLVILMRFFEPLSLVLPEAVASALLYCMSQSIQPSFPKFFFFFLFSKPSRLNAPVLNLQLFHPEFLIERQLRTEIPWEEWGLSLVSESSGEISANFLLERTGRVGFILFK